MRKSRLSEILRDDQGFPYPEEDSRIVSAAVMAQYLGCTRKTVWAMMLRDLFPKAGLVESGPFTHYVPATIYRLNGWGRCASGPAAPAAAPCFKVL